MVMSQRAVNRARIADVVRWFIEDAVVVTGEREDELSMAEVWRAVDLYVLANAAEQPLRFERYDETTGRWRPLGTNALFREVLVEQMFASGVSYGGQHHTFRGLRIR
jgi:hypothetical protein